MVSSDVTRIYSTILHGTSYSFTQINLEPENVLGSTVSIDYCFVLPDLLDFTSRKMRAFVIASTDGSKTCRHINPIPVNDSLKCRIPVNGLGEALIFEGGLGSLGSDKTVLYIEYWKGNALLYRDVLQNVKEVIPVLGSPRVFGERSVVFIAEEPAQKFARGYWDDQPGKVNCFNKYRFTPDYGETLSKVKSPKVFVLELQTGKLTRLEIGGDNIHPTFPTLISDDSIVFSALETKGLKTHLAGLSRCFNRPSSIQRFSGLSTHNLTSDLYMALAPIVSPDGTKLVFAGHSDKFSTHCTELDLFLITSLDVEPSKPIRLCIPKHPESYNGLYLSSQTESELIQFLPDKKTIIVPSFSCGRSGIFLIDTDTQMMVQSLFPPVDKKLLSSVMLLKTQGYNAVFLHQGYTCLRSLWLARIDCNSFDVEYIQIFDSPPLDPILCSGFLNAHVSVLQTPNCPAWLIRTSAVSRKPLIAYLHGGPHMAAINQYSVEMAAFLSQGYDIVIPNYRGSFSYGRPFLNSLIGKAGIVDVQDCHDCVLMAKQMLNPTRIIAYGGSHGGFLTAWLLGRLDTRDTYDFGVLWNPAVDLVSSNLTSDIPEWAVCEAMDEIDHAKINVFAPSVDFFEKAAQQSPMSVVQNVKVPSLVLLGANDKRVVPCAGLRWAQAVEHNEHKASVDVMWYPDQGHAINGPEFNETAIVTIGIWIDQMLAATMFSKRIFATFLGKTPLSCEEVPAKHDSLFDVSIPCQISVPRKQDLFSTAHRCMHDLCWFPPARAYVLGLFVDTAALNRLKTHPKYSESEIFETTFPKSFILFFASSKDSKHIRNGFYRSFMKYQKEGEKIEEFLSVLNGHPVLKKGDFFRVSCLPASSSVIVSFSDESEICISNATCLIEWIHWLYLGLPHQPVRYKGIREQLVNHR